MSFTNKWENEVMNYLFGATAITLPTDFYIGLATNATVPADDGTGITEPSGGAYARVAVTRNTTNFASTTTGEITNANAITFPKATADWGTITHFVIYDASTAGNALAVGALGTNKSVLNGDTASFASGALKVSLT